MNKWKKLFVTLGLCVTTALGSVNLAGCDININDGSKESGRQNAADFKYSFDEKYIKESLGLSINIIEGKSFSPASGGTSIFDEEKLYATKVRKDKLLKQDAVVTSGTSYESVVDEMLSKTSAKVGAGASGTVYCMPLSVDFGISASSSYEVKSKNETTEFFYRYHQNMQGYELELYGYKKVDKFSEMLSDEFKADAKKVETGELTAKEFIDYYGTHVITSAYYGASVDVEYYSIEKTTEQSSDWTSTAEAQLNAALGSASISAEAKDEYSRYSKADSKDKVSNFKVSATGGSPQFLAATSIEGYCEAYQEWVKGMSEEDYTVIDVPDGSLYCNWDYLSDEYAEAKKILTNYMHDECEENYNELKSKINHFRETEYQPAYKDYVVAEKTYDDFETSVEVVGGNYFNWGWNDNSRYGLNESAQDSLDLSDLKAAYNSSEYLYVFDITLDLSETNDGYQEIYLYDEENAEAVKNAEYSDALEKGLLCGAIVEHTPSKNDGNVKSHYITWYLTGDKIKETMYIRYDSSGGDNDVWVRDSLVVDVTVIKAQEINVIKDPILNKNTPVDVTQTGAYGLQDQKYDMINLSDYVDKMSEYYLFVFDVSVSLQEVNNGCQEIYLYSSKEVKNTTKLDEARKLGLLEGYHTRHGGTTIQTTEGEYSFTWYTSGDSIPFEKTDGTIDNNAYIRYDAYGDYGDTWTRNSIVVTLKIFDIPAKRVNPNTDSVVWNVVD